MEEQKPSEDEWIHENEAAMAFACAMAGEGVRFIEPPREGKIDFVADRSGLFVLNEAVPRRVQHDSRRDVRFAQKLYPCEQRPETWRERGRFLFICPGPLF